MKRNSLLTTIIAASIASSGFAFADLPVALVEESRLPYDFSPSNYNNSSSNYANSISNYANSPSNYSNSSSNYVNSSSNYTNTQNGKNRLIYNDTFVGYYVNADGGLTNIFSAGGKRVFYNPSKTSAVFSNDDGSFCGVIAQVDGKLSLALTDKGFKLLLLSQ